jgi:hypothetical protein
MLVVEVVFSYQLNVFYIRRIKKICHIYLGICFSVNACSLRDKIIYECNYLLEFWVGHHLVSLHIIFEVVSGYVEFRDLWVTVDKD